jgi:carbamoyltransferase
MMAWKVNFMAYAGISTKFIKIPDIQDFLNKIKNVNWNVWEEKIIIEKYINGYINKLKQKYDKYDLAYTFQKIWIDDVLNNVFYKYKDCSDNLVFSGGCALNCMLNYYLVKSNWFKKIYWNPIASDTGQSVGAIFNYLLKNKPNELNSLDINEFYCTSEIYDKAYFYRHIKDKLIDINNDKLIEILEKDGIVGICRGNIEMGPRALGHRSILASPLNKEMHDKLNAIKNREWYRPYGILIPREYMNQYFDIDIDAPYMNVLGYCKKEGIINGAMHLDGTVRIQTVSEKDDKWLHDLLIAYGKKTGTPILINTSFNVGGKPISNYAEDMYKIFEDDLDGIVFEEKMRLKDK